MRYFISVFVFIGFCAPAQAHLGHVGEVAGHGHIIGIGLLAGAAALAALLRKHKRNKGEKASGENEGVESEDAPAAEDLEGAKA